MSAADGDLDSEQESTADVCKERVGVCRRCPSAMTDAALQVHAGPVVAERAGSGLRDHVVPAYVVNE